MQLHVSGCEQISFVVLPLPIDKLWLIGLNRYMVTDTQFQMGTQTPTGQKNIFGMSYYAT